MERLFQRYFFLILAVLMVVCLPKSFTEKLKESGAAFGSFVFKAAQFRKKTNMDEIESLRLENVLLSNQIQADQP